MRTTSRARRHLLTLITLSAAAASSLLFGKEIVTVPLGRESAGAGETVLTVTFDDYRAPGREINKSVTVAKGDTLKVRLPSQALGYLWRLSSPPIDGLERIVPKKDQDRPEKDRSLPDSEPDREKNEPGGREYRVFQFRAEGEGTIEFSHVHSGTKRLDKVIQLKVKLSDRSTAPASKGDSKH